MRSLVLIGPQRGGKSTLSNIINEIDQEPQKTLVPEYIGEILDTPGEYIEHRNYFSRFQVITSEYKIIAFVLPCKFENLYLPPNFMSMFPNHKHIGIITKADLGDEADIQACIDFLKEIGITEYYPVSIHDKQSIVTLQHAIEKHANV